MLPCLLKFFAKRCLVVSERQLFFFLRRKADNPWRCAPHTHDFKVFKVHTSVPPQCDATTPELHCDTQMNTSAEKRRKKCLRQTRHRECYSSTWKIRISLTFTKRRFQPQLVGRRYGPRIQTHILVLFVTCQLQPAIIRLTTNMANCSCAWHGWH